MALGDTVQSGTVNVAFDSGTTSHITLPSPMTAGNTLLVWIGGNQDGTFSLVGGDEITGNIDAPPDGHQEYRGSAHYISGTSATATVNFTHSGTPNETRAQFVELEGLLELVDFDTESHSTTPTGGTSTCGTLTLTDAAFLFGGLVTRHNVSTAVSHAPVSPSTELADASKGARPPMWLGRRDDATTAGTYDMAAVDSIIAGGGPNRGYMGFIAAFAADAIDPPPPPLPGPPFVCVLDDDDFSELLCVDFDQIEDPKIRLELQGTGSAALTIHRSSELADEAILRKGNWIAITVPQILPGEPIFLMQIEQLKTTVVSADEEGGETIVISGRGAMSYFERAAAWSRSFVVPAGEDPDGILHGPASTGNKAGQILNRAFAEWQHADRGVTDIGFRSQPLRHMTHDFDYDDDSDGNTWNTTDMTAEMSQGYVGENGLVGILELIGTDAIDILVWPDLLCQAFNSYGRDLTGVAFGADVVRFVRGVNIEEVTERTFALGADPNITIIQGSEPGVYAYATAPGVDADSNHVEGFLKVFGTDESALEAIGLTTMARRLRQGESVRLNVRVPRFGEDTDPENGLYLPGPPVTSHPNSLGQYWLGDEVTIDTGSGFHDFEDLSIRVMAIIISTDEAGDLVVTVELKGTVIVGRFGATTGTPGGGFFGSPTPGGTGGGSPAPPPAGAETNAHIVDPTDAHDASAISVDATGLTNTDADDVQEALEDLDAAIGGVAGDADLVHVNEEIVGGPGPTVEADLAELFDAIDWGVDSVGSLTAGGSPVSVSAGSTHRAFPGLCRLDARRVLLVYRDGTGHLTGGSIVGMIGTLDDDHQSVVSWGNQFTILDATPDLRGEDAVSVVDNQIVVAFREYDGTNNENPQIVICDDAPTDFTEASTWGTPIAIPLSDGNAQNYTQGYVHKLANDSYILGMGYQDSGDDHVVGVWKWTGSVANIAAGSFVTVASGADDHAEIAILETTPGTVLALVRSVTDTEIKKATSTNSGTTWGSVTTAFDGYGYPAFRMFDSGLGLTVYRDAPDGDNAWRPITSAMTVFGSETILDTTGSRSTYATILQLTPTKILVVYATEGAGGSSATDSDLWSQIFTDSSTFTFGLSSTPSGAAGGDLSGTYPNPSVVDDSHNHTSATAPTGIGPLIISDTPSTPLVFADLIQNEAQDDLVYADV